MKKLFFVCLALCVVAVTALGGEWVFQDVVICGRDIATDAGEAAVNLPGFKNPYGVTVAPDGKVWTATYYSRKIYNPDDTFYYPDLWYVGPDSVEVYNMPIWIYDPTDGTIDTVRFINFPDETQDTLKDGCRGMTTDANGNIIYTDKYAVYQINYQTYEGMNKFELPDQAACPETDDEGYIYVTTLFGGTPLWILDPDDLSIYNTVTDNVEQLKRNITVSPDGKDVYVGCIISSFGLLHYNSDYGPDGSYAITDTILSVYEGTNVPAHFVQWDPAGLIWVGTVEENDLKILWALDPAQDYAIVDSTSFTWWGNTNQTDTTNGGYPQPWYIRAPRDAAFSVDGQTMYIADMYGYTIKAFEYVTDDIDTVIALEIPSLYSFPNDTLFVPVNVQFPVDSTFSSAEITICGYLGQLDLITVDTSNSLVGAAGWTFQFNETDSLLITASAGAEDLSGEGVLFWMEFAVPDTAVGFIPIALESALFDTGAVPVELISGGVNVLSSAVNYGDVDLNGLIQAYDAAQILKYLVGYVEFDEQQKINANVSWDTTVSALDATIILQYVVGLIDNLPYDTTEGLLLASGTVRMEASEVQAGQLVEVPLYLHNSDNILSFEGLITFNPDHLNYEDIVWSSLTDNCVIETKVENGDLKFVGAGSIPNGDVGVFATLQFTVNENINANETVVTLARLRFNEGELFEDAATAVLTNMLSIDPSSVPQEFALYQNYPNPFNPITTITYQLPKPTFVEIAIYSITGQLVETLVYEHKNEGYFSTSWNAEGLGSGIYIYRIDAGGFSSVRKCLIVK